MKIRVVRNGPYLVTGDVPLFEKHIVIQDRLPVLKTIRQIETPKGSYALCRCGGSKNPPFCDGIHGLNGFDGTEAATHDLYEERADLYVGAGVDLLDDGQCAYARFCHRGKGSVWELVEESDDPENQQEAIQAASLCPTGRLTVLLKSGEMMEPELSPSISFVEDRGERVSAGLFVEGRIPIEGEDGQLYEVRNRQALCRCGASEIKPFCDAMHVSIHYKDGLPRKSSSKKE